MWLAAFGLGLVINLTSETNMMSIPQRLQQVGMLAFISPQLGSLCVLILWSLAILALMAMWLTRKRGLRVLLLRPFGRRRLSKPLQTLTLSNIGSFGTVYTLSDRNYRPSILLKVIDRFIGLGIIVTGPIFGRSYRVASIKSERSYINLARKLAKWRMRSLLGILVGDQAFNIKSSDEWWRAVIDLLVHSTEILIMDISQIGPGSAWEIGHMTRRGLLTDCLFIAQEGLADEGIVKLANIAPETQVRVWAYRSTGEFVDAAGFDRAIEQRIILALANNSNCSPRPTAATADIGLVR
jgi:hypothetical protein